MKPMKYFPLIQKPDCCSVACLQMILFRKGHTEYSQDELAKELGIFIDKKNQDAFSVKLKVRLKESDVNRTIESADKINAFFRKNKIRLEAKSYRISEIKNPSDFINDELKQDFDVWVEFANKPIFGTDGGHDCLISELKKKDGKYFATLIDPYWSHKQIYEVPLDNLTRAMQKRVDLKPVRERGLIVIREK
jgi:hypothetical protein